MIPRETGAVRPNSDSNICVACSMLLEDLPMCDRAVAALDGGRRDDREGSGRPLSPTLLTNFLTLGMKLDIWFLCLAMGSCSVLGLALDKSKGLVRLGTILESTGI